MIYSLAIYGAPYTHQASLSAYHFAQAALKSGHTIYRVFFYHDGVYNASNINIVPQNEHDIPKLWADLATANNIDLIVCIAAALRRGIVNEDEAKRYELPTSNVRKPFVLSGLGQLVEAGIQSDRLITFGA
jgi:tRNA 2-thiouridine synthesizing protein D